MLAALLILLLAPTPAEARMAARRVLERGDYQTRLPIDPADVEVDPARRRPGNWEGPDWEPPDWDAPDADISPSFFSGLASALWWVLVAVVVSVLLFWLVSQLGMRRAQKQTREIEPKAAPGAAPAMRIVNPQTLAAEGRHAEAIHMLLLTLFAKLNRPLSEAWTSREVIARAELEPAPRSALEEIVRAVEVTRFGGRAGTEQLYRTCVARADEVVSG